MINIHFSEIENCKKYPVSLNKNALSIVEQFVQLCKFLPQFFVVSGSVGGGSALAMQDSYDPHGPSPPDGDHDELEIRIVGSKTHIALTLGENIVTQSARKKQWIKVVVEIKRQSWPKWNPGTGTHELIQSANHPSSC